MGRATNRCVLLTHMAPPPKPASYSEPSQYNHSYSEPSQYNQRSTFMKAVVKQSSHRFLLDLLCGHVSYKALNSASSVLVISWPQIG